MSKQTAFIRNHLSRNTTVLQLVDPFRYPYDNPRHIKKLGHHGDYDILYVSLPGYYPAVVAAIGKTVAGSLTLSKDRNLARVSSVIVSSDHSGKQLGLALYEFALREHGRLLSSVDLSTGSSKAWVHLVTKYGGSLLVPTTKTYDYDDAVNVTIHGWSKSGQFSWPIVMKSNSKVSLLTLLKSTDPIEKFAAERSVYDIRL